MLFRVKTEKYCYFLFSTKTADKLYKIDSIIEIKSSVSIGDQDAWK
ncbi:hypothetical protein ZPR_2271 [Zunongwangia profunda SM-A87]|uniref:Uncharacterized protein n=1 Tax=Zunongwangia profunda (strain DSM 18752 / CCTCC AB 206139 / SM-A87) TaxID=655815 RepID=D5BBZ6_ZUNPS|nr:hypothetical protein ZPR_2271 [Zunongwangia profunda SM-A87]|tara:strand:+ start:2435 stop:2572 length:138 start_codon:yes stop_codon:yes gene_type:complete